MSTFFIDCQMRQTVKTKQRVEDFIQLAVDWEVEIVRSNLLDFHALNSSFCGH
jgi:hypothetical protein